MNVYQFIKHLKQLDIKETPQMNENNASRGIAPKYTFLTDISRHRDTENQDTCSPANSLLSMNLESNLGDSRVMDDTPDIHVSICLFRKNTHAIVTDIESIQTTDVEYLSYYMELEKEPKQFAFETPTVVSATLCPGILQFRFPSFTYSLDEYQFMDEDVDPFKEACIEHILNLFSMEHIKPKHSRKRNKQPSHPTVDFGYHGMIRHANSIYVFFDMNAIERYFRTSPTHFEKHPCVWAVVDEIVRKHSVFSIPVHPSIVELFMENPMLWNISYEGTTLSFPRAMYGVVPSAFERGHIHADDIDELYESMETPDYKTATHRSRHPTKSNIVAPLLPFAHSDLFAERFLFTDKPIPIHSHIPHFENGLPKYKRFVVFIYNPKFLFSKKFKSHRQWINEYPQNFVENMDEEDDDQIEEYRKIPCICFSQKLKHHKPVEMWGVIHDDLFAEILQK